MVRWVFLPVLIVAAVIFLPLGFNRTAPGTGAVGGTAIVRPQVDEVIARGRIEPEGGVVAISGPPELSSTVAIVDHLLVEEGETVAAGQKLAILNGFDLAEADHAVAVANLQVARLRLAQVRAGVGKVSQIAAQSNVVEARRAQLQRAEKELERAKRLVQAQTASIQILDTQRALVDQLTQEVQEARNALGALSEVRQVDDALAKGEVAVAEANLARAVSVMNRLEIRAPTKGTILSIQARDGELIGPAGILRMADLERLVVTAEVDQRQVQSLREGMSAQIAIASVPDPIPAKVSRIAREVYRQQRPASDILTGRDAKIVEVQLAPETELPAIVGAEVSVRIFVSAGQA